MDAADVLALSAEEQDALALYLALLKKWNGRINLVAPSTLEEGWTRHMIDSAQVMTHCESTTRHWADFGSGGGFPGLVVAILAKFRFPDLRVTLVESDQRKAAFLRSVSRETGAKVEVRAERVEKLGALDADVISARALAPLNKLFELSEPHLAEGGTCVFLKGQSHEAEIAAALANWRFTYQKEPSLSHDSGVVLSIGDLRRA